MDFDPFVCASCIARGEKCSGVADRIQCQNCIDGDRQCLAATLCPGHFNLGRRIHELNMPKGVHFDALRRLFQASVLDCGSCVPKVSAPPDIEALGISVGKLACSTAVDPDQLFDSLCKMRCTNCLLLAIKGVQHVPCYVLSDNSHPMNGQVVRTDYGGRIGRDWSNICLNCVSDPGVCVVPFCEEHHKMVRKLAATLAIGQEAIPEEQREPLARAVHNGLMHCERCAGGSARAAAIVWLFDRNRSFAYKIVTRLLPGTYRDRAVLDYISEHGLEISFIQAIVNYLRYGDTTPPPAPRQIPWSDSEHEDE